MPLLRFRKTISTKIVVPVGIQAVVAFTSITSIMAHQFDPKEKVMITVIPTPASSGAINHLQAGTLNSVVNAFKIWRAGSTLTVCFYGGSQEVKQLFISAEGEWAKHAHITWDFGQPPDYRACDPNAPSHIRVSFDHSGSWSRVGKDSIQQSVINQASLNIDIADFGNFALADKDMIKATMMHEQGHALGLEHEHQNPDNYCIRGIKWDLVYEEMAAKPNKWDKAKVDENYRALVDTSRLRWTEYDRTSIMHYSFPARWFSDPSCAVGQNLTLSSLDISEIEQAYPADPTTQSIFLNHSSERASAAMASANVSPELKTAVDADIKNIGSQLVQTLAKDSTFTISNSGSGTVISSQTGSIVTRDYSPVSQSGRDTVINIAPPPATPQK